MRQRGSDAQQRGHTPRDATWRREKAAQATHLGLVARMAHDGPQLILAVRELRAPGGRMSTPEGWPGHTKPTDRGAGGLRCPRATRERRGNAARGAGATLRPVNSAFRGIPKPSRQLGSRVCRKGQPGARLALAAVAAGAGFLIRPAQLRLVQAARAKTVRPEPQRQPQQPRAATTRQLRLQPASRRHV